MVEAELLRVARRLAGLLRSTVLVGVTLIALVRAAPGQVPALLAILAAVLVWSAVFVWGKGTWIVLVDTALVVGLCLAQQWIVLGPDLDNSANWVLAAVSSAAVAHQWYTSAKVAFSTTTAMVIAYVAGVSFAMPEWVDAVPIALWTYAETGMSRGLFVLIRAAARSSDRSTAQHERAQREVAVAAARRADEREYLAALHDTAASTMLAVGLGMVDGSETWLAEQARRDVRVLSEQQRGGQLDLAKVLADVVERSQLEVELTGPAAASLPAEVAMAISQSVQEALANVARHAGVAAAALRLDSEAEAVRVRITDHGQGFDPALVSPHRRGITMSIVERMDRVGGLATIESRPGTGTTVQLAWPRG
ncbi:ATP-binding protein [Actinocrispum sp. NPDC049592]|uniref:sensor histidine kinase n=1 Tax=Actinocrispum sp. NPDC049592 TaxID=3154835 RepID=UPI00342BA8E5